MPRHKMPTRTKRRLIAASVAAVALIGTAVGVGIYGAATAADGNNAAASAANQECLPDPGNPSGSATATTAPETTTPPADPSETPPPADTSGTETPSDTEIPSDTPTETTSTEAAPEDAPPAESPPETQGIKRKQPETQEPAPVEAPAAQPAEQQPTEGPSSGGSGSAPDEGGAAPQVGPPPPAAADTEKTFGAPDCTENQFGPSPSDFINIRRVARANLDPRPGRNASRGTFTTRCGNNEGGHRNPDNFIVAPGVRNGAHHTHDYVGNDSADANSTNESLAAAGTTCRSGDKSVYFWPVMRVRDRNGGPAGDAENPHNTGAIQQPRVSLQFRGNAQAKVVAMPQFLRIITGDAKASINGGANANAKWTCTGFRDRFTPKYPICPRGSQVQRVLDFASCWDGQNIDSANHRAHVVFPDRRGACPQGTQPIPQLRMTLTYNLPRGRVFAVDAFPEVSHNPSTDHGDFVNLMPDQLMNRAVDCINRGRNC